MEITTELLIAVIAVLGSVLGIWLNSRKLSHDLKSEHAVRAVWQASVDARLETLGAAQSEIKIILQEYTKQMNMVSEKQVANEVMLKQIQTEQAKMWKILDGLRGVPYDT